VGARAAGEALKTVAVRVDGDSDGRAVGFIVRGEGALQAAGAAQAEERGLVRRITHGV